MMFPHPYHVHHVPHSSSRTPLQTNSAQTKHQTKSKQSVSFLVKEVLPPSYTVGSVGLNFDEEPEFG